MVSHRKIRVEEVAPGSVLAAPVLGEGRTELFEQGAALDASQIAAIRGQGIREVVIEWPAGKPFIRDGGGDSATGAPDQETATVLGHGNCNGCSAWHAFLAPAPRANAQAWYCQACGAVVYAKTDPDRTDEYSGIAPLGLSDGLIANIGDAAEERADSTPPEHLQRLVRMLTAREFKGVERRRYKRYAAVAPVVAVPLGEDFRVIGKPIRMTTTNVSHDGIGLIHTQYLRAPYFALDFTVAGLELRQAIVKLLRVRGLGPVYESGGRFVRGLARKG
jgi:hypothetical protein